LKTAVRLWQVLAVRNKAMVKRRAGDGEAGERDEGDDEGGVRLSRQKERLGGV
jgi:hypothetical protein